MKVFLFLHSYLGKLIVQLKGMRPLPKSPKKVTFLLNVYPKNGMSSFSGDVTSLNRLDIYSPEVSDTLYKYSFKLIECQTVDSNKSLRSVTS